MHPSEGILSGVQATCQVCQQMTYEPMVCAGCVRFGHPACWGKGEFFDFFFCSRCIPQVTAEHATFRDAQRQGSWKQSLTYQVSTRAIEAIGFTSTLGVTVGSAVATAAGAAAGLAHGAVRGAVQVASASRSPVPGGPAAVPALEGAVPPPPPRQDLVPVAARRARSQGFLTESTRGRCLACWTRNPGHRAHFYRGDCIGLSGQRIWAPVSPRRSTPAGQGGPSSDPVSGQRRLLPLPTVSAQSRHDAAGLAVPDSQGSLFTSLPSVADDPRGSPLCLDGGSALGQEEDPPPRGRSGRPIDAGLGHQTMSGNSLEVALGVLSASRGPFDVALGSQTMSGAPTPNLVATRSMDQPTDERARAGEAPQVGLGSHRAS